MRGVVRGMTMVAFAPSFAAARATSYTRALTMVLRYFRGINWVVMIYMIFCRKDAKAQRKARENKTREIFASLRLCGKRYLNLSLIYHEGRFIITRFIGILTPFQASREQHDRGRKEKGRRTGGTGIRRSALGDRRRHRLHRQSLHYRAGR